MLKRCFRKSNLVVYSSIILVLVAAIACGAAEQPTQGPQATAAPPAAQPTAMPQPTSPPAGEMMAGIEHAPSFAEYWTPPTSFYGQPVKGGEIRYIYEDPLEHANTWGASAGPADRMRMFTGNRIVSENPYQAGQIIPDLAQGWTLHEGATGVTFRFHDNITWHQGQAFTCEDARFWMETMLTGEGITASAQKGTFSFVEIDSIGCDDDLTFNVGFKGPSGTALLSFAKSDATLFNKEWFLAGGEKAMFQDLSQGTGAFIWEPGQKVGVDTQRFERNPNYWKGDGALPYADTLVLFGIADESAQQAALLAHEGNFHWVRNWGQYDAYVNHQQIMTVINATRGHLNFWINPRKAPFDNVPVRQAVTMAIDREAAVAILQDGHGAIGQVMPPGGNWALDQARACAIPGWCQPADMKAQRAEAKKILEGEGFDFNQTYLFTVENDSQVVARATFVQEQLRLLGIKTDFDTVENIAYDQQQFDGTWGHLNPSNATMPADDPFIGLNHYHGSGSVGQNLNVPGPPPKFQEIQNQVDGLLLKLATTLDEGKRKALADELQILIMENYLRIPIYWEQEAVAFWPEVRGYAHAGQPSGSHIQMEHVWIDPAHKDDKNNKGQISGVPGGI